MRRYYNYQLKKTLTIKDFKTIEYLHLQKGYRYPEETHDFYEIVYLESGFMTCDSAGQQTLISAGDLFLIPPGRPHSYRVDNQCDAVAFIVCFQCTSAFLGIIEGRSAPGEEEKQLVAKMFAEAKQVFTFPFRKKITVLDKPVFGAQQLVGNYLEELLIRLIRARAASEKEVKFVAGSDALEQHLVADICGALEENLYAKISLGDLEKRLFYSKTYLNNIFKKHKGSTIIHTYIDLKIKESIKLLEKQTSVAKIADLLYFESPNYFSKVFKKHTGFTPAEYRKHI